jgi:hypothetical protein
MGTSRGEAARLAKDPILHGARGHDPVRSVSAAHRIFSAIEVIAAHCDAWS